MIAYKTRQCCERVSSHPKISILLAYRLRFLEMTNRLEITVPAGWALKH